MTGSYRRLFVASLLWQLGPLAGLVKRPRLLLIWALFPQIAQASRQKLNLAFEHR